MASRKTVSSVASPFIQEKCLPSEINALPLDWVPNKKPSKAIEKMFTERKHFHEQRLEGLKDDMTRVKIDTEEKIRRVSTRMRNLIQENNKKIDIVFARYSFKFDPACSFNLKSKAAYDDMYRNLKDAILRKCTQLRMEIAIHDTELKTIENERMAALTEVLKRARIDLERLSYKLPHELQLYFEQEMMQLNQMTLCNHFTYSKLQMQLTNVVLSSENAWIKRVEKLRNDFVAKYDAYSNKKSQESIEEDQDGVMTLAKVQAFTEKISAQICQLASKFEGALDVIYGVLNRIEQGRYDEVQQVDATFVGVPKREYLSIYNDVYPSLFEEECFEIVGSFTIDMMNRWQDVVDILAAEVDVCIEATLAGMHIWDKHFVRQLQATDIFSLDLWDVVSKSNDTEDAIFVELHKEVDQVRMAPDEESLNLAMGECNKLIGSINKSIEKNYDKHVKHFEKLREMMINEGEILYLEMSYFVKCMPNDDDVNPTIFRGRRSRVKLIPPEDKPELMKVFDSEIKAMHNWLYGVSEHLKTAAEQCRERSLIYANNWIDNNFIPVFWNYKIKISLVDDMWQRIFHHVYRIRSAELLRHQQRLDQHLLAVNNEINNISLTGNIYAPYIFGLTQQTKKLNVSLKKAKSTLEIASLMKQVNAFKETSIRDMKEWKLNCDEKSAQKLSELLLLNVEFIKSIKLFNEQGDYNPEEFNDVKKSLSKATKDMSTDKTAIDRVRDEELNHALEEIENIEKKVIEETSEKDSRFKFKEFLKQHIETVREAMKEETKLLVDKNNSLSTFVERLERLAEKNIGKIQYLEDFTSNCEYMEKIFKELYDILLQKEVFTLSDSFFRVPLADSKDLGKKGAVIMENMQEKLGIDAKSENNENTGNVIENPSEKQDDFRILFPSAPSGDDYMARIVRILFESLEALQEHAQEYYRKESENGNKDKYEKHLKTFMISHLSKYFFYQLQCDEILLEVIINYILELDELLTYITDYYKRSLEQFVQVNLLELQKNCTQYKAEIHLNRECIEDEYRRIIDQLKPLHGHPRNRNLLDDLTRQLNTLEDLAINEQAHMDNLYTQYQAKMEDNMCIFEEQVDRMESRLKRCVERFITRYIANEEIFNQLRVKLAYFERIMNPGETVIDGSHATINIEIVDRLNSKLQLLKMGLKVSTTEFSSFIKTKWTEASTIKEKYSSDNYLTVASKPSLDFYLIMEDFRDKQIECLKELESSKGILDMCEFWSGIFKSNVNKVNSLYKVKYVPVPKIEPPLQKTKKQKNPKL